MLCNGSTPYYRLLDRIFKLSHLLIRGLIKGLSPNKAIFSTFIEMYHYLVYNGSWPCKNFIESAFEFSHPLIRGMTKPFSLN